MTPVRKTVRLLLLDESKRLLLMKVDDPTVVDSNAPGLSVCWVTLGGRLRTGEGVRTAAWREAREEIGQDIRLGPKVWYGEQVLTVNGQPTLFKETFMVAFVDDQKLSFEGWTKHEKRTIKEIRWWTLDELRETAETVFPFVLKDLLPAILDGDYPKPVLRVALKVA